MITTLDNTGAVLTPAITDPQAGDSMPELLAKILHTFLTASGLI